MEALLDLEHYPLDRPDSDEYRQRLQRCQAALANDGLFDLAGLLRSQALGPILEVLRPLIDTASFTHQRRHNIYFSPEVPGLARDHPALREMETVNRTVCADQMGQTDLVRVYEWAPLRRFLAEATAVPELFVMEDDLARVNVMSYRDGEALNWHFDRSEFTTTLLLQQPAAGGDFEYRPDLRADGEANHDDVGRLVSGLDEAVRRHRADPGTLTVFAGRNTAHRVTPAVGKRDRIIAVFSYYERPGVMFTPAERLGFYGRS